MNRHNCVAAVGFAVAPPARLSYIPAQPAASFARMLDQYTINGVFDEMFEAGRVPRPHYNAVVDRVVSLDPAVIQRRRHMADLSFRNLGITFTVYSEKSGVERIFPFDLIPRIITARFSRT